MRKNLFAKFFNIIAIYREILHFTEIPLPFAKFIFAKFREKVCEIRKTIFAILLTLETLTETLEKEKNETRCLITW